MLLKEIYDQELDITEERIEQAIGMMRPVYEERGDKLAREAAENLFGKRMAKIVMTRLKQTIKKTNLASDIAHDYKAKGLTPSHPGAWNM